MKRTRPAETFVALPAPPEAVGLDALDAAIERATSAAIQELHGLRAALATTETQCAMYRDAAEQRGTLIDDLSAEVDAVRTIADERLSLVDQLTADVGTVRATAAERLTLIEHLSSQTEAFAAQVERLHEEARQLGCRITELQAACDDRLILVDRLSAESAMLRAVAEDRAAAIDEISAVAERRAVLLADLTAELESRTRQLQGLRRPRS